MQTIQQQQARANVAPRGRKAHRVQAMLASSQPTASNIEKLKKIKLMTAVKTPYLHNGKFDLKSYDAIVDNQIKNGVEGIIVGGTTGEGHLMGWDEHIMLIAHTVNCFGDRVAVVGNTGSNSTREALHATEQGFAVGMHAALQINPYYGKTSKAGLLTHFTAVLNEGPAVVYNVPGRTGQDIPDDVGGEGTHASTVGVALQPCTPSGTCSTHSCPAAGVSLCVHLSAAAQLHSLCTPPSGHFACA